jgi:hypothetical protein
MQGIGVGEGEGGGEGILLPQAIDGSQDRVPSTRIQPGRGFVEDQESGPHRQHRGQRQAFFLAAGEGARDALLETRQSYQFERRPDASLDLTWGKAEPFQAKRDLVGNAGAEQLGLDVLQNQPDLSGQLAHRYVAGILPADDHSPVEITLDGVRDRAVERQAESAFAGSHGPHDRAKGSQRQV